MSEDSDWDDDVKSFATAYVRREREKYLSSTDPDKEDELIKKISNKLQHLKDQSSGIKMTRAVLNDDAPRDENVVLATILSEVVNTKIEIDDVVSILREELSSELVSIRDEQRRMTLMMEEMLQDIKTRDEWKVGAGKKRVSPEGDDSVKRPVVLPKKTKLEKVFAKVDKNQLTITQLSERAVLRNRPTEVQKPVAVKEEHDEVEEEDDVYPVAVKEEHDEVEEEDDVYYGDNI